MSIRHGSRLLAIFCFASVLFGPVVFDAVSPVGSQVVRADDGGEHTGGDHAGEDDPSGDELPADFRGDLALWTLVVFLLFMLVLKKVAWGPMTEALDSREANIRRDIATAEASRIKAEKMLKEYEQKLDASQEEVREIIAEARRDADQTRQNIVSEANAEAEATRKRALGEIERARDAALQQIFSTLNEQIATATEHVLGRSITEDDRSRLVTEALDRLPQPHRN